MKTAAPTIKSQIEAMSGQVIKHAPQSDLARMIAGDIQGGKAKHDYIMSVITSAIEQAFKGNLRNIPEALKLCGGKSVKARAYHAGFHAIADWLQPATYTGALSAVHNTSVREDIANRTRHTAAEFEQAYLCTFAGAKAAALDKRAEKAHQASFVPAPEVVPVAEAATSAVMVADAVVVDIAASVDAIVSALSVGMLSDDEIANLTSALAQYSAHRQAVMAYEASTDAPAEAFAAAMAGGDFIRAQLVAQEAQRFAA